MNGFTYLIDWQISHTGREATTALDRFFIGFGKRLAIKWVCPGKMPPGAAVVPVEIGVTIGAVIIRLIGVTAVFIAVIIRPIAVLEPEIRARREYAGENESGTECPERLIVTIGPESKREDITPEERPEYRSSPASPATAPVFPSGSPEITAPVVPGGRVAECVAVKTGSIEIG
jgi:hypothetical protein